VTQQVYRTHIRQLGRRNLALLLDSRPQRCNAMPCLPVDILRSQTVGRLNNAIKKKMEPLLNHIATDQLEIWKVGGPAQYTQLHMFIILYIIYLHLVLLYLLRIIIPADVDA
jgi:hypothetical protein